MQTPEVNIQEKAESPLDQGVLDLPTNQEPEKNKTFGSIVARTITGVLYVVAIVLCIQHPMAFLILFAALTGLCTWEFCTIVNIGLRGVFLLCHLRFHCRTYGRWCGRVYSLCHHHHVSAHFGALHERIPEN